MYQVVLLMDVVDGPVRLPQAAFPRKDQAVDYMLAAPGNGEVVDDRTGLLKATKGIEGLKMITTPIRREIL